jgi:hypothetical protein
MYKGEARNDIDVKNSLEYTFSFKRMYLKENIIKNQKKVKKNYK